MVYQCVERRVHLESSVLVVRDLGQIEIVTFNFHY